MHRPNRRRWATRSRALLCRRCGRSCRGKPIRRLAGARGDHTVPISGSRWGLADVGGARTGCSGSRSCGRSVLPPPPPQGGPCEAHRHYGQGNAEQCLTHGGLRRSEVKTALPLFRAGTPKSKAVPSRCALNLCSLCFTAAACGPGEGGLCEGFFRRGPRPRAGQSGRAGARSGRGWRQPARSPVPRQRRAFRPGVRPGTPR